MRTGGRIIHTAAAIVLVLGLGACAPAPGPTVPPVAVTTPYPSTPAAAAAPQTAAPTASVTPSATAIPGGWSYLGRRACPDESAFECITLSVPRDHFTAGSATWDVEFGIRRATGTKVGTLVVITGGPGSSGISAADGYTDYYPASIPERFDIVFLDQRGIGRSHPIGCPEATAVYYASDVDRADPAQADATGAAAKTYVADCLAEAGADPDDLPFYSTRQAVEDLEAIREYLGVEAMHLYGESYGTQYAQTYAKAHPDRVATLYLDGPVDLTLDGATYYAEAARTFEDTLFATLNTCEDDAACAADFEGKDPVAAYDALEADARDGGIPFDFPMGDGTTQARTLNATGLENAVVGYLYAPTDRFLLLRALAAASDGNLVPLARISYAAIAVDPDTLEAVPDPSYSDALYYAVECQDYVYQADKATEEERLAGFLADARTLGAAEARFGGIVYDDMPCLYWPNRPASGERPEPIVDAPYPTVVLVATTDPITPVANAMRLANRLRDVHVVIQDGGPHVIFGWGLDCPDNPVADFMVKGTALPPVLVCEGYVADDYVTLAKDTEAEYADGADVMTTLVAQVLNSDDYVYELDEEPIRAGCDFGGVLVYTPGEGGTALRLDACELTDGMPVTGSGSIDDESGIVTLEVTLPDGSLRYEGDGAEEAEVTGTFRGAPVTP
ncbi:MAG TPA: alpha/beta fold hydrolase [Candidatus Limnocylindrales bacterium]|nr:alpha/beta fold hydrolase [Candidatus Limnocylindrales bacterium]